MRLLRYKRAFLTLLSIVGLVMLPRVLVFAQTTSSTNYSTTEYYFGTGGENDLNSTNYKARGSAGSLGVGNTNSTNYTSQTGYVTAREEYLEMVVNASTVDLGTFTTTTTGTGTATFYVRAYTASGYTVKTITGPPVNGAYTLAAMSTAGASTVGTEQFGINLVGNTAPSTFGLNPAPQPNSGYAFGAAATGYDTTNNYKYNAGDTIASSPKGIGQTNFTISYIANISAISRGGEYTVDQILLVTATY